MYDTVDFYLLQKDYPNIDFLKQVPKHIYIVSEGAGTFGEYIIGYYSGYKVKINRYKISFSECSLARFKFGNNLKSLTCSDTEQIFEQMQDELHLPVHEAKLTRIDLAQHFSMNHSPELYLPLLGESRYYERLEQPNGINYINSKRVLVFYNKTVEQQEKFKLLPVNYEIKNLLRYELRFKKRLPQQFSLPEVTCSLLYDRTFLSMLARQWKEEYSKINKVSLNAGSLIPTGSSKYFIEQLAGRTIQDIGQNKLFYLLKEWQGTELISKKQAFDIKKSLQKISKSPDHNSGNELINELDRKIEEAAILFQNINDF